MKYLMLLVAGFMMFAAQAQDEEMTQAQDSVPFEFSRLGYIYQMAKSYNDPTMARMALYNLLSYSPGNSSLLDSLSLLYYDYNQLPSAALTAQDAATINPDDMFAVEMAAICFEELGVKNKAISYYEKLYLNNDDPVVLYKVAFLQYDSKKYDEADVNADIVVENAKSGEIKLLFPKTEEENQEVSLKAATLRLKAMVAKAKGDNAKAKEYYNQSLAATPDFEVVKKEMAELK